MTQSQTLISIQYLRGLSALAVVAFHTGWTRSQLGQAGVDVFFVISGFVMVVVRHRETAPCEFLSARIVRVVPLYWLSTLLAALVHQVTDPWHLAQSFAFWPHRDPEGHDWPVLLQGWTLCFEAYFYALFALSLLIPYRTTAMTITLLTLIGVGVALRPANAAVVAYTSPLLIEFLAGMWICEAWHRGYLRAFWPAFWCGVVAFGAEIALPEPGVWRWVVWGIPAALVVSGLVSLESAGRLHALPGLQQLGNSSYALYLTHMLVQTAIKPILQPLPSLLAIPIVLSVCIAVGWLTHLYVEQPIGRWLANKMLGVGPKSFPSVAALSENRPS